MLISGKKEELFKPKSCLVSFVMSEMEERNTVYHILCIYVGLKAIIMMFYFNQKLTI